MSWETVKLGDVAKLVTGKTPSTSITEYFDGDVLWVTPADFKSKYISETSRTLTQKAIDDKKCNLIPANSVVLNCIGDVGKVSILREVGATNQQITSLIPTLKVSTDFLYYSLLISKSELNNLANNAVVSILNNERLKTLPIALPHINEQNTITQILDKADTLRKKDKQLLQYYDDLLATLFSKLFGDPVQNQKNWNIELLGEFVERIQIGPFGTQLHSEDYISNGIPLINPMHISNGKIVEQSKFSITEAKYTELSNYYLKEGDIIMGRRGEMGRCALVSEREDGWICGTGSLYIRPGAKFNSLFLSNVLSSKSIKEYLESCAQGVTMANLNKKIIYNIPIIYPAITLQNQFALQIQNIELQKEKVKAQIKESENLFQALLQKAFNGGLN